jgi:transcriptional regulator with GAF, ATPase, and Fis domain
MNAALSSTGERRSLAFQAMAVDILENVLRDVDNPDAMGACLAQQMRELTEAGTVILFQRLHTFGENNHRVVCVKPERRRPLAEAAEVRRLAHLAHDLEGATIWSRETASGEAEEILSGLECGLSVAVPLSVGAVTVGALLLLDLPDAHSISLLVRVLDVLSTVVALVFRNALSLEEQEAVIERRTHEFEESEERFRTLVENVPVGVYRTTPGTSGKFLKEPV